MGSFARTSFFVLLPALAIGGALGVPVLFCLAGALSFRDVHFQEAIATRSAGLWLVIGFFAIAVCSSLWSPAGRAEIQAAKVIALALFGFMFASAASRSPRLSLASCVAAFVVLAILLGIEALLSLPFNRAAQPQVSDLGELARNTGRGAGVLLALTWAACAAILHRTGVFWKTLGVTGLLAAALVSAQFGQLANAVAFAFGLGAFIIGAIAPRIALALTSTGLLVWLWAAPFVTPWLLSSQTLVAKMPLSWQARADIWDYVCARIIEQPWWGHGLDAGRAHEPNISVHPHSASLQVWFDTGLMGVLLLSAAIVAGVAALLRGRGKDPWSSAAVCGTVASLGVIANLSYNLWAEWWLATFFLAAGLVGALLNASAAGDDRRG